jgi:hypothetical protein
MRIVTYCILMLAILSPVAVAGEVDVTKVRVMKDRSGYTFVVTLRHGDEGWKHYANRWEVLSPDGKKLLGVRKLLHPHVNEQPFTRRLSSVRIPKKYKKVIIRGHDTVHGFGGHAVKVKIK